MSFFTVDDLSAGYGQDPILSHLSFSVDQGNIVGILGANGSGKTTLLKSICGILPHEGDCFLNGISLKHQSARNLSRLCSYIPQRSGISIDITALDVVLMGFNPVLKLLEQPNESMKTAAMDALKQSGIAHKAHKNYLELSEGEKQLCLLARTLVSSANLLLLDEPESALDFRYRSQMLQVLREWVDQGNRAALLSLHDHYLALNHCDRIVLLSEGHILGIICPARDSLDQMESMMEQIYGKISLHHCISRSGQKQLVMIKERE